jgi:hypothetical protein
MRSLCDVILDTRSSIFNPEFGELARYVADITSPDIIFGLDILDYLAASLERL